MNIKNILVATDFSDTAQTALEVASQLAHDWDARLLITHVKPSPEHFGADEEDVYDEREPAEHEQLCQTQPTVPHVQCEHRFLHGRPSASILHVAEKDNVDLIVIGTHGETNAPDRLTGAVAEAVLAQAPCAVVIVKSPAK